MTTARRGGTPVTLSVSGDEITRPVAAADALFALLSLFTSLFSGFRDGRLGGVRGHTKWPSPITGGFQLGSAVHSHTLPCDVDEWQGS